MAATKEWVAYGWKIEEDNIPLTSRDVDLSVDTTQFNHPFRISYAMIRYSTNRTETVRIVLKPQGSAVNSVYVDSTDLAAGKRYFYAPNGSSPGLAGGGPIYEPGDILKLTATNTTGTGTAFAKIVIERV